MVACDLDFPERDKHVQAPSGYQRLCSSAEARPSTVRGIFHAWDAGRASVKSRASFAGCDDHVKGNNACWTMTNAESRSKGKLREAFLGDLVMV